MKHQINEENEMIENQKKMCTTGDPTTELMNMDMNNHIIK